MPRVLKIIIIFEVVNKLMISGVTVFQFVYFKIECLIQCVTWGLFVNVKFLQFQSENCFYTRFVSM